MAKEKKTVFALFFGNRGFFPASLQKTARKEMVEVLKKLGHETLIMDEKATGHGAVETVEEGRIYADWLRKNHGKYGGVILCLPNFGDETGAVEALKDAGVPILVQAYPDDLDKMAPELRRDAFCGKFSIMDVFYQYGVKFTALKPHTVNPKGKTFADNIDYFDRLCRVVNGVKNMVVGAIGARTTAFKTVRIDELALQRNGITMETYDLSGIFHRMDQLESGSKKVKNKAGVLKEYSSWDGVPQEAFDTLVRLAVVIDDTIEENRLDAVSIRCWLEMQENLRVSPCVLLSELNNRGIPTACEVDVGNAVTMFAMHKAAGRPATCLDWNNNYGDDDNKCILFHCGSAPQDLMTKKGRVTEHAILRNVLGEGCSYGCNVGRIAPTPFTYGSMLTEEGKLKFYFGEGRFTKDPIADDFFGCAGVAEFADLQSSLQTIGYLGYRHHTSVVPGKVMAPVVEALERYLGFEVITL